MAYKFSIGAQTLSGSVTLKQGLEVPSGGTVTLQDGAIDLVDVDIDGGVNYGAQTLHQTQDKFPMSDNGTNKSITFSDLEDSIFANVSGDATIAGGGALTIANDAVEQAMIADDAVGADQLASNAVVNASVATGAAIDHNKLANITAGRILMGNASNVPTATAISGDISLANNGAVSLANDQTNVNSLKSDSLVVGRSTGNDHIDFATAGSIKLQTDNADRLVVQDSMVSSSVMLAVGGGIQIGGGQDIDCDSNGGNATLFESIGANTLTIGGSTSTITVAGNFTVQGTTTTVESQLVKVDAKVMELNIVTGSEGRVSNQNAGLMISGSTGNNDITLLAAADGGKLKVSGSAGGGFDIATGGAYAIAGTTVVDADGAAKVQSGVAGDGLGHAAGVLSLDIDGLGALGGTGVAQGDHFVFSDGGTEKKITFSNMEDAIFGNVSGDATIAAGGALTIANDAVESGMLNDNVISGQSELADGGVVDADELLISDGGTLKKVGVDSLKTYMTGLTVNSGSNGVSLSPGFTYFDNHGTAISASMPSAASVATGSVYYIKAGNDCSATNKLTINKNAAVDDTFDATLTSIVLESPNAQITFVKVGHEDWRLM